ncbi:MAG: gamma subclass chorismate mutase AroQ [Candidatus Eremiobacteraeota bacterium]|nr:gamma subclass chorismate mutase AroQ [Candidatus Eremiobacteraeota bacterium]MCW5869000.1 gamma subclass chorismate mutase AroQ [Candidatus Eremiobacteraeota bacterium]
MKKTLLFLWLCSWPALAQQHIDKLLQLMQQRLALAPTVAQVKWNNHLPVEDPAREEQLLEKVPEAERAFLRAQFEASKVIQQQCRRNWVGQHSGVFPSAPTLSEIRSQLDQVTREMLQALEAARPELARPELLEKALSKFPESDAWNRALEPLR